MRILYQPEDGPPASRTLVYSVQWLAFSLVNVAVVPLIVGAALGLDRGGIAELAQRTMLLVALASLLQATLGHRLPIIEGPASMWMGIFLTLAAMAPGMGKDLAVLRTDLELGMGLAGLMLIGMGLAGLLGRALKLFTPAVTGTVLVLLTLLLAGSFVRGMLGLSGDADAISPAAAVVSTIVIATVVVVNLKAQGFVRSIAVLIAAVVGWVAALLLGLSTGVQLLSGEWIRLPAFLAWGSPTFDPGIMAISLLTGLLVLSNSVASIVAMERTLGGKLRPRAYDRGVAFTGVADVLAGLGAAVGLVPYSASAGLVSLTGVGARAPFVLFAVVMLALGLLPPVGQFLSAIPGPVGYSILLVSFCQMLGLGLKDYARLELTSRQFFVIGLPLLLGVGIQSLPPTAFASLPIWLRYVVGNGFVAGMLFCLLIEHVLLPARYFGE